MSRARILPLALAALVSSSGTALAKQDWHTAGGVVVDRARGKVLLVKVPKQDTPGHSGWTLPKGRLEPGESRASGARREIREESGVVARVIAPLRSHRTECAVRHYYLMEKVRTSPALVVEGEVSKVRWVKVKKAWKLLDYDLDRQVLREAERALRSRSPGSR